jgi:hypothetical protein
MLDYVAAVATAATLMISPMIAMETVLTSDTADGTRQVGLAKLQSVWIPKAVLVLDSPAPYSLSDTEQQILKRALLRSVRIVHSGHRIT